MARRWIDVFADLVVASAMGSLAYGADGWLRVAFVVIALLLVFIAGGRTVMALIDGEDTP